MKYRITTAPSGEIEFTIRELTEDEILPRANRCSADVPAYRLGNITLLYKKLEKHGYMEYIHGDLDLTREGNCIAMDVKWPFIQQTLEDLAHIIYGAKEIIINKLENREDGTAHGFGKFSGKSYIARQLAICKQNERRRNEEQGR